MEITRLVKRAKRKDADAFTELDIKEEEFDFEYLSKNALIDACAPGNPFEPTLEETITLYKELF